MAGPPNDYVMKDRELDWLEPISETLDAFTSLKSKLEDPFLLDFPQPHRPYLLDPNAYTYALGAGLRQQDNDRNINERTTFGCWSQTLNEEK